VKVRLQPSGTGPFKVEPLGACASGLELSRFDGYWDKGARAEARQGAAVPDAGGGDAHRGACWPGQVDWIEVPAPDAMSRACSQGGMTIVTNKYPHNWAYQPSMVRGLALDRHRVSQGGQSRDRSRRPHQAAGTA
jgi:hypothetical protein